MTDIRTFESKAIDHRAILGKYQAIIDAEIIRYWDGQNLESRLVEACRYSLEGGKRFRPALVYLVAEALGSIESMASVALALEFFHGSSLVADDMPCMDNDAERRGRPAVHVQYGETIGLLASYALIGAGYHCLTLGSPACGEEARLMGIRNVAETTGIHGLSGGQFLDLFPPNRDKATLDKIVAKKTVSLFESSFVLGWIYGGGCLAQLDLVKKLAAHFGMAFQIADDLDDESQDFTNGREANYALVVGSDAARSIFAGQITAYFETLRSLKIDTMELIAIGKALERKVAAIDLVVF